MNSDEYQTISTTASSVGTETLTVPAEESVNGEDPEGTMEDCLQRPRLPQLDLTCREKSPSPAMKYYWQRNVRTERPRSSGDDKPRDFLTGVEYRTKFMREIRYDKETRDRMTAQNRMHRPWSPYVGVNHSDRAASRATEYAPRRRTPVTRSLSPNDARPREFLTGVEYRTKFMRQLPSDAELKFRVNSGAISNSHPTRVDTRKVNKWRHTKSKPSLLKYPLRKKSTEVTQNLPQTFPNRKTSQFRRSTAGEMGMTHAIGPSGARADGYKGKNPPFGAQKNPETMKAGETPIRQSLTKSNNAMKAEDDLIRSEEEAAHVTVYEAYCLSPPVEQTSHSTDPNRSDNFMLGFSKVDLSINLPNSPISEPTGSNSLHTTPRSPRIGQKNHGNSLLQIPISETISLQSDHSLPFSETLEMQRTSSPPAKVSCSPKRQSPSNKYKFLPSSVNTKSRESFANRVRNKTITIKREPVTFTTQFVPLLRWTNKTNSEGLFEPYCHEGGSNSRPNSTNSNANPDDDNASNDRTPEGELSNKQSKETTSSNGKAVQNECYMEQQQGAADEDYGILHPSLMNTSGEGENLGNVRRAKNKSTTQNGTLSKDSDRSHTRNHMTPVKQAWKLTGSQQIVSGFALWPATTSPLLKRPESVKNIAMAKQPAGYSRSTKWPVGDFARRPISAAVNKKPVWK